MIDIDSLLKGQDYSELKESYILFICKEDPFDKNENEKFGLPCYTFKSICEENPDVNLNDKTTKVVYNSSAWEKEKDQKALEASIALLKKGIPAETIAECEGLPLEKVLELQKGILVEA